ncbi:uncharacterized protein LOC62_02G002175 [Vanrija pseudolonga]|uniref:Uncharacterized protein n=1 Tax=Vanrija pseudolonga TaxID=143232 RepID=A0AAF0Y5J2_9TREE|nr:hypothetical protein LOC62_02G002175 [Vanrija pseudolonga]
MRLEHRSAILKGFELLVLELNMLALFLCNLKLALEVFSLVFLCNLKLALEVFSLMVEENHNPLGRFGLFDR